MNKELENASYLDKPSVAVPAGNVISGCSNYSQVLGGVLNSAVSITAFFYCVQGTQCGTPGVTCNLLRYATNNAGCPIIPKPRCGSGIYEVVVRNISPISTPSGLTPYFQRAKDVGGIELNFNVGTTGVTANRPNPVFLTISTKIPMNKSYSNTLD